MLLQRTNQVLLFAFLFLGAMILAHSFLIPLTFGALVAMLMLPLANFLERKKLKRIFSTILCFSLFLLIIVTLFYAVYSQLGTFQKDIPSLKIKATQKITHFQDFIQTKTGFDALRQDEMLHEKSAELIKTLETSGSHFLSTTSHVLVNFSLFLVYFFFFLMFRAKIKGFFLKIMDEKFQEKTTIVIYKIAKVTQQYLAGKMIVLLISATLNSVAFLIIGIEHAIFFGVLAAFLGIIPYVGTFLGAFFPAIIALLTQDTPTQALAVVVVIFGIHFVEGNILIPAIIGEKVNLNALTAMLGIITGGMIWGVAGMVLFIPLLGIFKIICDHVPDLNAIGYLIGNEKDIDAPLQDVVKE